MLRDVTAPAVVMGLLAAFVGYASSFAIVLAGLTGVGATAEEAATGLFFAGLGMGVCSIWLPALTRIPAAVAWSTPGAAFLASSGAPAGGFAEAVGALIVCAGLIVATGLVPALRRAIGAIPKPVASALLAGVLLKLCFAPALALGDIPLLVLPVILAWLAGLVWNRIAAMPFAILAFAAVMFFAADDISLAFQLPEMAPVTPSFSWLTCLSVGAPLYLVTMAGQNVPGFTVLEANGYPVERGAMLRNTGFASLLIAPFGAAPVNMSAITASMMCGEDAGANKAKRYWAAIVSGFGYVVFSLGAGTIALLAEQAPAGLITAVAGLALLPALTTSLKAAFEVAGQQEAPALTFLIAASGMALFGVSGAFWGLVVGVCVWAAKGRFAAL